MSFTRAELAGFKRADDDRKEDRLREAKQRTQNLENAWSALGGEHGFKVTKKQMVTVTKATLAIIEDNSEHGLGEPDGEIFERLKKATSLRTPKGKETGAAFFDRARVIFERISPSSVETRRRGLACRAAIEYLSK